MMVSSCSAVMRGESVPVVFFSPDGDVSGSEAEVVSEADAEAVAEGEAVAVAVAVSEVEDVAVGEGLAPLEEGWVRSQATAPESTREANRRNCLREAKGPPAAGSLVGMGWASSGKKADEE